MSELRERLLSLHTFLPVPASAPKGALAQVDPGVGVLAGLVALVAAFWNLHVVVLFFWVVLLGGVDLLVGFRRVRRQERLGKAIYDPKRMDDGMFGKAVYLLVNLLLGMCSDMVIAMIGNAGDLGFAAPFQLYTPITSALLFWRLLKESTSITRNIKETPGGEDAIWPGLARLIDALRFRMTDEKGAEVPSRRWADDLSPEERKEVEKYLMDKRRAVQPEP